MKKLILGILLMSNMVYADYSFTKEDLVGVWRCKGTATIKGVPNSWGYTNSIIKTSQDGTSTALVMGEAGFHRMLWRAFLFQSSGDWILKGDKLYSRTTHINNLTYYDTVKNISDEEVKTAKENIIKHSSENYQYPSILRATDKDNYSVTSTVPLKEEDIFENISPTVCQRMMHH